jgi:UDP-glucose 4-epimerase
MNVLITGGAGFIGSSVADRLLESGNKIMIIDNYETGKKENNTRHSSLNIVEGSITDKTLVEKVFREFVPEIVVHAAASYKDPLNWEHDISTNVSGMLNLIRSSIQNSVKKFIYLQTSLCYGLKSQENPITLDHPLLNSSMYGLSSYAVSKTTAELYLAMSGLNFTSFRLANVYGPRNLSGPLPTFFHRMTNDLKCTVVNTRRDFIYIDDVVEVIVKSAYGEGKRKYYHISTGKDHSIKELYGLTSKELGKKTNAEEKKMGKDDVATILLDPSETKRDFDWAAKVTLEEGVRRTIAWYRKNPVHQTYTHLKNIN